jgi:hypothetical protein
MGRHRATWPHSARTGRARMTAICAAAISDCGIPGRRRVLTGRLLWVALAAWWIAITAAREAGFIPMDWRSGLALVCGTIGVLTAMRIRRMRLQQAWRESAGRMAPVAGNPGLPASSAERIEACEARLDSYEWRLECCEARTAELLEVMAAACQDAGIEPAGRRFRVLPGGRAS